jgi:exopolysaccharide production protein ExoQ
MQMTNHRFDLFLYAYLIMLGGSLYYLFGMAGGADFGVKGGDTLSYQSIWVLLYLALIFKIAQRSQIIVSLFLSSGFVIAFVIAATLSCIVNGAEIGSLIKFSMYLMSILFAAWVVSSISVDQVLESLFRLGIFVLILHFMVYPVSSSFIWDPLERPTILGTVSYGGLFGHKNIAGTFFALSALVCLVRYLSNRGINRPVCLLLIVLHLMAITMTGAMGPLVSVLVASAITIGVYLIAGQNGYRTSIYWMLGAAALLAVIFDTAGVFALLGRDQNLTGRLVMWSAWPSFFWERPLFGYGFGGLVSESFAMVPTQYYMFDNSYLEIGIAFGSIGGLLFGLILLKGILAAFRFSFVSNSLYRFGPIAIMSFLVCSALFESSMILHNYISSFIIFWAYFGLEVSFLRVFSEGRQSALLRSAGTADIALPLT